MASSCRSEGEGELSCAFCSVFTSTPTSQLAKYHTSPTGLQYSLWEEELQYLLLTPGDRDRDKQREKQLL